MVAKPVLVTEKPWPPVAADRSTADPLVVRLAVPPLLVAEVAVKAALTVALAVAPTDTTSTSEPDRSVIVSVPA